MDKGRIAQLAGILIACHGTDAEDAARQRANRCLRRKEPEWAALWREVTTHIAKLRTARVRPRRSPKST